MWRCALSDVTVLECPRCGGTALNELAPNKRRCAYCGSILTSPETPPAPAVCPRCGFDNERSARFCSQCGAAVAKWPFASFRMSDPAVISMIVTFVGLLIFPMGGAALGLVMAYRARNQARATGGASGSEQLARTAIAVGWGVVVLTVIPICVLAMIFGGQFGSSLCNGLVGG